MARYGKKSIKIDAPVMIVQKRAIWMDEAWVRDFFGWMNKHKFKKIVGIFTTYGTSK